MKATQGAQIGVVVVGTFLAWFAAPFAPAQVAALSPSSDYRSAAVDQIPDSPGAVQARLNGPQAPAAGAGPAHPSQSPEPVANFASSGDASQTRPESGDPSLDQLGLVRSSPTDGQDQQETVHEPVGTAVAEPIRTTGIAAARPAGAALAPGKQRRTRSILIRVGVIVGAGVAVGTTFALSRGSPGRPPGSH
jgi:hypothetical protein